jgi:hypothetical protein
MGCYITTSDDLDSRNNKSINTEEILIVLCYLPITCHHRDTL